MSHTTRFPHVLASLGVLSLVLTGCATTHPPAPSGFLGNYDDLTVDASEPSLLWWEKDGFDWKRYRGVILEPVIVRVPNDSAHEAVSAEDLAKLSALFHEVAVEQLGKRHLVDGAPAPDVLRVRCAITDVVPIRPAVNLLSNLAVMANVDVGGAAIEVEFLDSVTGERLAAGVDRKRGHRIDGFAGLTRYGQARSAFRDWAKQLRVALETNP